MVIFNRPCNFFGAKATMDTFGHTVLVVQAFQSLCLLEFVHEKMYADFYSKKFVQKALL